MTQKKSDNKLEGQAKALETGTVSEHQGARSR